MPNSCLEQRSTGCNTAQHRTTTALEETMADLAKHPTRRHDTISLEALPKLRTRVRFPSSAPHNAWSEAIFTVSFAGAMPCSRLDRS